MARKRFHTMLDEDVILQLKLQAVKEHTGASKIIERLLKEYFKRLSDFREGE